MKTNGGNGGYNNRKAVIDKPNPQKTGKKAYDYKGKSRGGRVKKK